ncbi:hypothetical protein SAMN02745221_00040 [Thermosyntropha lipolytica DSM 11003]|uniref:Uncharacterized protein n=1 Tax=Thermosyntropha lipolytica DSM 11003 TaxID=1123382 RepID=A0A1M5JAP8_9FIRM|nr:hypothetical protein [Thermosyntropha lipolytica]SHG37632.1 hypothetical protein SAMN02745221_00040 [Thermosyntropha lipolytica DSM 11003]
MHQQHPKGKDFKNFTKIELPAASLDIELDELDIMGNLGNVKNFSSFSKLFLNRFTEEELYAMLKAIGMIKHLGEMGFSDIQMVIDRDENDIHYLNLYWKEPLPENQLLDLRVSESLFMPAKEFFAANEEVLPYDMIVIEWLSSRNPLGTFTAERPQLPGQKSPGLGILKYCFKLLYNVSSQIFKDGYFDIPTHMHGAIMYSKQFKFFDPVQEAMVRAITRDLKEYSLADISWGIITGTIIDIAENKPAVYEPSEQVHYISERMAKYFHSPQYINTFQEHYHKKKYRLLYEEMVRKREEILSHTRIEDL